jgi:hypothetical protein
MYHPTLTFILMQTRQQDLVRGLERRELQESAQRTGSTKRTPDAPASRGVRGGTSPSGSYPRLVVAVLIS